MKKITLYDYILKKRNKKETRKINIMFNGSSLIFGSVEEVFKVSTAVWTLYEIDRIDYIYDVIIDVYVNI